VGTSVRIIEQFGAIDHEARKWSLLAEGANSPMHQYAWMKACSNAFADKLHLIVVGNDQPRALGPLVIRGRRLTRMECLGVTELYEPTDFPHSDLASLTCLANTLVELRRPVLLRRILADSPVLSALKAAFHSRAVIITRPVTGCPWIALDRSWTDPETKLSPSRRSSLRRAARKANQVGSIEYEVLSPTPQQLGPLLVESMEIEAASWKGRNRSALLNDAYRRRFFEQYTAIASDRGILRLCFMRIAGRPAAMQIAVECGAGFWLLKVGYDEGFARCSPGNLLMLETLRYAASRGLGSYEFLGSVEPWTEIWTDRIRPCVSVWIYPHNVRGLAAFSCDALRFGWERLNRQFNS
jgi:CelD/BcsL family acetyltransferase involved in cellulose biosynthesis